MTFLWGKKRLEILSGYMRLASNHNSRHVHVALPLLIIRLSHIEKLSSDANCTFTLTSPITVFVQLKPLATGNRLVVDQTEHIALFIRAEAIIKKHVPCLCVLH